MSSFIAYFWSYNRKNPPHARRLTLPDGSIDLMIVQHVSIIDMTPRRH
ncbi:hypothetical protein [Paenibacillus dokdonensis]